MSRSRPVSVRPLPVEGERGFYRLGIILMIVGVLHWAQAVFLPLALAVLFAFALTPVAGWLERRRLRRIPSAVLSTGAMIALVAALLTVAEHETERLIADLRGDVYSANITRKLSPLLDLVRRLDRVQDAVNPEAPAEPPAGDGPPKPSDPPAPVVVRPPGSGVLAWLPGLARPVAEVAATLLLVAVLTTFMLIQRDTTRDRLLGLASRRRLTIATRALDDAAGRVGRFLLLQAATNAAMGLIVGVALALIGVPYAPLWGVLTAGLRFLPYVGIWLAVLFPFALAVAVFPGWWPALLVLAVYGGFDLVMGNVVEPLLFGHGTGVSSLALLVAAVFWAFLWGPVGLLLAVPLTVCLVVLGEHIPSLGFLRTLLGNAPDVDTGTLFFHRALVEDADGAALLVGELAETPLAEVYEKVLLPALIQAKAERGRGSLEAEEERRVYGVVRAVLGGVLAGRRQTAAGPPAAARVVVGCPAQGPGDRLALGMLRDASAEAGAEFVVVTAGKFAAEIDRLHRDGRAVTGCVVSLAPGGLSRAGHLCEQVRAGASKVDVTVGRWGRETDPGAAEKFLRGVGAAQVSRTFAETLKMLAPHDTPAEVKDASAKASYAAVGG